jgi:hypothetical protein
MSVCPIYECSTFCSCQQMIIGYVGYLINGYTDYLSIGILVYKGLKTHRTKPVTSLTKLLTICEHQHLYSELSYCTKSKWKAFKPCEVFKDWVGYYYTPLLSFIPVSLVTLNTRRNNMCYSTNIYLRFKCLATIIVLLTYLQWINYIVYKKQVMF